MTPVFVEIMLWHYVQTTKYGGANNKLSDSQQKALKAAIDQKMLSPMITDEKKETNTHYEITARGKVYVTSVLNVGFPRQAWDANYPEVTR